LNILNHTLTHRDFNVFRYYRSVPRFDMSMDGMRDGTKSVKIPMGVLYNCPIGYTPKYDLAALIDKLKSMRFQ
jgi:hypothetical protein